MNTPPIMLIGAVTMRVALSMTSICTCWASLVFRVMSDGAPKWLTSRAEKPSTRWNRAPRTSRPNLMAAIAPARTAPMVQNTWSTLIPSMIIPNCRM